MRGKKFIVGFLVLLITSSIIYIALQGEGVKLRVDKDKTTLYVFEDSRWKIGGKEYNKLFDGTRRLYRDVSNVKIYVHINETTNTTTIIRETPFKRGPFIRDTYYFRGDVKDKKRFPIYHKVEIYNASGLFYRYEVRDLVYSGPTYKLNGSIHLRFERNVDVTLNPDYRWAWVYKSGIVKAQYDVKSDYEVFYVRLFDPESTTTTLYLDGVSADRYYEHGTLVVLKANVTDSAGNIILGGVCYQEHANISTDCGGLNNGSYSFSNNFNDGDWDTYTYVEDEPFYINYSKPKGAHNTSVWQVKDISGIKNLSIPAECWNQNPLQFRFAYAWNAQWQCYNGSGFEVIGGTGSPGWGAAFEEAMWWNSTNPPLCLDIDQEGYGDSFVCSSGTVKLNLTANCVLSKFNDSTTAKNLTYTNAPENQTFYIRLNKYDEIQSAYINLTGFQNPDWPFNPKIYVGDILVDSVTGYVGYGNQTLNELSNGNTAENLSFSGEGTKKRHLRLPKNANVTSAHLNLSSDFEGVYSNRFSVPSFSEYIDINDTHYFVSSVSDGCIRQYLRNGTFEKILINTSNDCTQAYGFTHNGTYFWVTCYYNDNTGRVHRYYYNGTHKDYFDFSQGIPWDIVATPNYLYILRYGPQAGSDNYDPVVYRYLLDGTYDNFYFNVTNKDYIYYYNNNLYLTQKENTTVSIFDTTGNLIRTFNCYDKENTDKGYYDVAIDTNNIYRASLSYTHFNIYNITYPTNPYIQTADSGGTAEWNWTGELTPNNGTQTVDLNATLVNDYLSTCSADSQGYCNAPILFYSGSAGILEVSNIEVNYTYIVEPTRNINATAIQNYLDAQSSSGYYNIPIRISSETNSTIQVSNINISYYGSDNITVTAHFDGSADYSASNDTQIIRVVYSRFNTTIPVNYGYLEFIPNSPTDKNVPSYGQTETTPSLNISWLNYDQPADLYMKINETHPCINISYTTDYPALTGYTSQNTFFEGWESGSISSNWTTYSSNEGRIQVTSSNSPPYGSYHLTMDDSTANSVYSLNELVTNISFSGATAMTLEYYIRDWSDENTECPSSWSGHYNCDGIAITCDGNTWYKVRSFSDINGGYRKQTINLTPYINSHCSEVNSSFAIKFQQYDNYPIDYDGIGLDNITINYTTESTATLLDTSYKLVDSNKQLTDNTYIYLKADYNCNYTDPYWRYWLPEFLLKACAVNAVKCD